MFLAAAIKGPASIFLSSGTGRNLGSHLPKNVVMMLYFNVGILARVSDVTT